MPRDESPALSPIVIDSLEAFAAALAASLAQQTPEERAAQEQVSKAPRHPVEDAYLRASPGRNPWMQDAPMGPHPLEPEDGPL